jgi:DNA invertase Pin-like site-specific DNA recombinase
MANGKYVAYYRVSTQRQGESGLGLEGQEETVTRYLNGGKWTLVGAFTEVETGKRSDRPKLAEALAACRRHRATLIVAKLDRLARNTKFLLTVVEGTGDAGVVFCDMPGLPEGPVGKFMLTQMASVAELEAGLISQRTKAALQAAAAKGVKLGGRRSNSAAIWRKGVKARKSRAAALAHNLKPIIDAIRAEGKVTLRDFAAGLNQRNIPAPRGGEWSATQVMRLLDATR